MFETRDEKHIIATGKGCSVSVRLYSYVSIIWVQFT